MLFLFSASVKQGIPVDEELEELAIDVFPSWMKLGRLLHCEETWLEAFHKENEAFIGMAYQMLLYWKRRGGSAATYQVLYDALCYPLVERRDLAEKYCCDFSKNGL